MSLDALRNACNKYFQERADAATSRAISIRMRPPSPNIPGMSAEEYAMTSIDLLTEARIWLEAQKVITNEYRKLTEPEKAPDQDEPPKQPRRMYG